MCLMQVNQSHQHQQTLQEQQKQSKMEVEALRSKLQQELQTLQKDTSMQISQLQGEIVKGQTEKLHSAALSEKLFTVME